MNSLAAQKKQVTIQFSHNGRTVTTTGLVMKERDFLGHPAYEVSYIRPDKRYNTSTVRIDGVPVPGISAILVSK